MLQSTPNSKNCDVLVTSRQSHSTACRRPGRSFPGRMSPNQLKRRLAETSRVYRAQWEKAGAVTRRSSSVTLLLVLSI